MRGIESTAVAHLEHHEPVEVTRTDDQAGMGERSRDLGVEVVGHGTHKGAGLVIASLERAYRDLLAEREA